MYGARLPDACLASAELLQLIHESAGEGITRTEVMERTGLKRSSVRSRLEVLFDGGLVVEERGESSTGGRPPGRLKLNSRGGVVLAVIVGSSRATLAVADLAGEILAVGSVRGGLQAGPRDTIASWGEQLEHLLDDADRCTQDVRAVGVGLPGMVDFSSGRPVGSSCMPGWEGFPVADALNARFGVDVLVDGDANLIALAEARCHDEKGIVVAVNADMGFGLGYVTDGVVQRGSHGASADIGHIRIAGRSDATCRCGKRGCLEAVVGGAALIERLQSLGVDCADTAEVARLARSGVPEAIAAVHDAGRALGSVLAFVVNVLFPSRIVVAGDLSHAREQLLRVLRATVYRDANTLATLNLEIDRCYAGDRAGLNGTVVMALDHVLATALPQKRRAAA
jgi:predicted NBD/HSP70 family sugar kinase